MSKKVLVTCGDSFIEGVGLDTRVNDDVMGKLLANELDYDFVNFGRGGSSNFAIYLQVKYVVENLKPDFVVISVSSSDRTDFFAHGKNNHSEPSLLDVNHHSYRKAYYNKGYKPYPIEDQKGYRGDLISDTYMNIIQAIKMRNSFEKNQYASRFAKEPVKRLKLIRNYFTEFHDVDMRAEQDMGLFNMAHVMLQNAGIPHLFIGNLHPDMIRTIDEQYLESVGWYELKDKYPDPYGTGHCTVEGHKEVVQQILPLVRKLINA